MFRKEINSIDDYNNFTEEEKVDYVVIIELKRIIATEYAKAEHDQDMELINECLEILSEMTGIKVKHTEEEIRQNVAKAMERADAIRLEKANKTKRLSRVKLTACIAMLLLLVTQLVAMVFGYNPIAEIYEMLKSNYEAHTLDEEGITYTYFGEARSYANIDELIRQEELNILYPTNLPHGMEIIGIHNYYINEYRRINIVFNKERFLFQINEYHNIDINNILDCEIVYINEIEIYILRPDNNYEAIFYHDNYEYIIKYTEYDLLIEIIKNIGERK